MKLRNNKVAEGDYFSYELKEDNDILLLPKIKVSFSFYERLALAFIFFKTPGNSV